jgi:hypothetical protein
MTIEKYAQWFSRNEAFFGSDPGWYAVEITDCDTIIEGDHDRDGNVIPFESPGEAERYLRMEQAS